MWARVRRSPPSARTAALVREARQVLGALAVSEKRWEDALAQLTALAEDPETPAAEAAGFWLAAGDIRANRLNDKPGGQALWDRAAALAPKDSRLVSRMPGASVQDAIAHDVTDEMIV